MKKLILPISIFVLFLQFSPSIIYASQSGSRCETPGQVSQVCAGTRDYQVLECKLAAEDDCQGLLDRKEKMAAGCDDCIPGVVGWLMETCEGRESQRTAAEFEAQCTGPLKQLDEEYSKCRQTYAWEATGKGSCSVEGMVCSSQTTAGRRFDICRPGDVPQQAETEETKTSKSVNSTDASIIDWIKENLFGGSISRVKSLLDNAPTETDLKPADPLLPSSQEPLTGVVTELGGNVDMRLSDGTWVPLKTGDSIPAGATIFVGFASTVHIKMSNNIQAVFRSLEEVNMQLFQTNPEAYRKELKLEDGALRFKVEEGTIKTDMKVSTPNVTAAVVGTDFAVAYDPKKETSIVEIYDGTIEVENTLTGEKKTLTSTYGSPIKHLEAVKDDPMVEKIAVPKNQKNTKVPVWAYVGAVILVVLGLVFILRKRFLSKGTVRKRR